ncbi:hypothetical protein [Moorena sp. SIO3H5]|nr:hypothetical protein [Moorena sp. SIO3H5]
MRLGTETEGGAEVGVLGGGAIACLHRLFDTPPAEDTILLPGIP